LAALFSLLGILLIDWHNKRANPSYKRGIEIKADTSIRIDPAFNLSKHPQGFYYEIEHGKEARIVCHPKAEGEAKEILNIVKNAGNFI
jgi:hypothetical protein